MKELRLAFRRSLERFKGRTLQLLVLAIATAIIAIILLDILIEGTTFNAIIMVTQDAIATVSSWGYAGIFLLMFLESSSLPVPSEVVLPFSGYLVSLGELNLWITILIATLAGITGSLVDYFIGMKGMDLIARRKGKIFFNKARLETAERWFNRYGAPVVFLGRMVPLFRTLISFPAGAAKMSLPKFITYTMAGCLAWNAVLIYIGVYMGTNWQQVAVVSHYLIIGFLAVILVGFIVFLIRKKNKT
jgi:membrane protein DedA with SNARE-associated domain